MNEKIELVQYRTKTGKIAFRRNPMRIPARNHPWRTAVARELTSRIENPKGNL